MRKLKNEIVLKPSHWASVSGGKDSLYMLNLILHNLDKYPLDGVVHFELEIDFPFIKNVIDYMEDECKKYGITFIRIKPRTTWKEVKWYISLCWYTFFVFLSMENHPKLIIMIFCCIKTTFCCMVSFSPKISGILTSA